MLCIRQVESPKKFWVNQKILGQIKNIGSGIKMFKTSLGIKENALNSCMGVIMLKIRQAIKTLGIRQEMLKVKYDLKSLKSFTNTLGKE